MIFSALRIKSIYSVIFLINFVYSVDLWATTAQKWAVWKETLTVHRPLVKMGGYVEIPGVHSSVSVLTAGRVRTALKVSHICIILILLSEKMY